jgi:hypothetical protein
VPQASFVEVLSPKFRKQSAPVVVLAALFVALDPTAESRLTVRVYTRTTKVFARGIIERTKLAQYITAQSAVNSVTARQCSTGI